VRLKVNVPDTIRRIRMKSRKLCAVVVGSLVALAMSLPVMAQETRESTTTTTRTPERPQTRTTQSDKSKTKYNRHHHVKETKQTVKTKSRTVPGSDHLRETTTTTTGPRQ
jgi:mannitol-specific phosphotransferase system IIBC component